MLPVWALARAGGGEGFSGGGDGGGGGGGDGDGAALVWIIFQLLELVVRYPAVGVPVVIIVVVGYVVAQRKGINLYRLSVIHRGLAAGDVVQTRLGTAALQVEDPDFRPDVFLDRVRKAFVSTQAAWAAQDLAPVRAFLSDGVFERFSLQFAEQKMLGYRNAMADVQVSACLITQVDLNDIYQSIAVSVSAAVDDSYVSLKDGRRLPGSAGRGQFTEIWTFLRKRGVRSKLNAAGLIEGNCPNCGAAIEMNQHARCGQCGALLRSGQYDWVLSEITQECEWRPQRPESVRGVEELTARDPGFSLCALEDSASVAFWRLMAAQRLGKIDPIRKVASEEFCAGTNPSIVSVAPRVFYTRCGVGSVQTLGIQPQEGWDRAVVEVSWSGVRSRIETDGRITSMGPNGVSRLLMVFVRQSAVKTSVDQAISSAHCPNCGAPQEQSVSNACESCGTVLNDGSRSWVLCAAEAALSPAGQKILSELNPRKVLKETGGIEVTEPPARAAAMAWLVQMAAADGQIDEDEREKFMASAKRWSIPAERVEALMSASMAGQIDPPQPRDRDEARVWLESMVEMALTDGKVTSSEFTLLKAAGSRSGLVDFDLKAMITQTRNRLYAQARTALREARAKRATP